MLKKVAKKTPAQYESEIAALKEALKELQKKYDHLQERYARKS